MGSDSCFVYESIAKQEVHFQIRFSLDILVLQSLNLCFCHVHEAVAADDYFGDG